MTHHSLVMTVTSKTLFVMDTSKRNMELKGGVTMGLTPDQKIDLAIAYIKKCDNTYLLLEVVNVLHNRINELVEEYNDDRQEE
jgi:hypothetical protein